jgi:ribonuclease III
MICMTLTQFQERLGYSFGDPKLLQQAFTHVSYGNEQQAHLPVSRRDNERLEFLGDAVLDVVVSDILLETFPDANEGQLSKMRAAVVNERSLFEVAKSLEMNALLKLGKGEGKSGGAEKPSILSSAFEALIAAIYIDGGFHAVYPVVRHLFAPLFKEDISNLGALDFKTKLQEQVQASHRITPTYHLISTNGPDHCREFVIEVRVQENTLAQASGTSKKEAEQAAAREALLMLDGFKHDSDPVL